jgi:uncharacterized protein (DUF608 family)
MKKGRNFRGKNLLQIALPLGGIGAGCICLNGHGGLQDFSIRHAPATSADPDRHYAKETAFATLYLPTLGKTRLLEGPLPPEKVYNLGLKAQGYREGGSEGLPRFRECTFRGEYPFGSASLSDPSLPIGVEITGFNPFIPLDEVNSGLPCAILEYSLHNLSTQAAPYQFSYHLSHLAQPGAGESARSAVLPGLGVHFWNEADPACPAYGSAALGILHGSPRIKGRWFAGGWFDALSVLWREVSSGTFEPTGGLSVGSTSRAGGSVLVEGELAPGESVTYPVVIAWHFPNIPDSACGIPKSETADSGCGSSVHAHPFYSTVWKDAKSVLEHVQEHYDCLRRRTQAFHEALFSSTLPAEVIDAVSANLGILKSPTVLRLQNGDVWAWEGCFNDAGCCPGSCTHVWNYAQALPHLFPALERTLRQQEFKNAMDERGHITFRSVPLGLPTAHSFHAAADGQLGGILKLYREWQIYGDREWLLRLYPLAKRSLDFCIEQWDPRRRGWLEEPHHNTYDIEFWGPDPLCTSFYLGALSAMAAMAKEVGHPEEAAPYEELAKKGTFRLEQELFNGEYYEQKVLYQGLRDTSFADSLAGFQEPVTAEQQLLRLEGPKYQIGSGCLSDGVLGAWLAWLSGVETVQNRESIRAHLMAVYRHNFKESLWEHANVQRPGYALGDEPGLLLGTWPRGGKPTLPFVYSDEVWTGFEYQVASHLIHEGYLAEGLQIVRAARSRYDGHVRNPWNEYECGSYYARAMSSYALLIAISGFRYTAVTHTLCLAPRLERRPFRCFFSTASGWGTLTLREHSLEVQVEEGELRIDMLEVLQGEEAITLQPAITVKPKDPKRIAL